MTKQPSYDPTREYRGLASELERLRAQTLVSWRQEARLLAWLGLADGLSLLELGCGPGFVTEQLRQSLPHSPITALDNDPVMLEHARHYLAPAPDATTTFVEASLLSTGLPDNHFDFAIARYVFQHLEDPLGAAREAWRVLKSGGRLVIIDVDAMLWGIVEPAFPQLQAIYTKMGKSQAKRGGDRLIGRRLWRILQAAGYNDVHLDAFVYHSDELGLDPFLPQLDPDRLLATMRHHDLPVQELALAYSLYNRFLASPDAYVLMAGLMASGQK